MSASPRTVVLVQARQGSHRLPGKSLRPMAGYPMISHVLRRARMIPGVSDVWLVTSVNQRDDQLAELGDSLGFSVFRGSEWDVLQRMTDAARLSGADIVMRVTGDCPLLAPDVSGTVLRVFLENWPRRSYASNDTERSGFPDGFDTEVFSAEILRICCERALDRLDREHVTRWMRRELPASDMVMVASTQDWSRVKLSVDTEEDFLRASMVMALLEGDMPEKANMQATALAACRIGRAHVRADWDPSMGLRIPEFPEVVVPRRPR